MAVVVSATSQLRSAESYSDNQVQKSYLPRVTQGYRMANLETGTNETPLTRTHHTVVPGAFKLWA